MKPYIVSTAGAVLCVAGGNLDGCLAFLLCFVGGGLVSTGVFMAQEGKP